MSKLVLVVLVVMVSACSKETRDISENYQLPSELSDCKIYRMRSENGSNLTLVRCPNSSTATQYGQRSGKTTRYYNNTVIDNDH